MSMDSKQDFLRTMEAALSDTVTAANMDAILKIMSDTLEGYDMRRIEAFGDETDDCLECFISAKEVECRSPQTIRRYRYVITRIMQFTKVPTRRITVYHLRSFLSAEKARGLSDTSLENYREVCSSYFNWLQREGLIDRNPVSNLGTIKCAKKEKKTYSEVDIEKLNRCCKSIRDRAIIGFLRSTGCRVSEMTGLNRDSVDIDALECVVHGKGDKERVVYLSEVTGLLLREYLESRKDNSEALFSNKFGGRLLPGGVREMLKQVAKAAGLQNVHPHKFRRTLATELCKHGMSIQEVSELLGHSKIDVTRQYVILSKDGIKSSYRRYA